MLVVSQEKLSSFIFYLRTEYHKKDLYDIDHLWEIFRLYFNFLHQVGDPRLTQVNPLQRDAYKMAVQKPECAIWRTRRGGKTIMMTVLEVFWSLIQFGVAYPGVVVHRTPTLPQLKQYHKWLRMNPFVLKINNLTHEISVLDSENILSGCISGSNSDGLGASVLYEDELGTVYPDKLVKTYIDSTREFILEGLVKQKRHLHASTARYGSIFHDDMKFLEEEGLRTGEDLIHKMTWRECSPWITPEMIEKEKRKHFADPNFILEMFECELVPKGGLFFPKFNWTVLGETDEYPLDLSMPITAGGIDFNGTKVGHIMIEGHYDKENNVIYCMTERKFDTTQSIHNYMARNTHVSYEVEGQPKRDGYNAGFTQHLLELKARCKYQSWDKVNKSYRLGILQNSLIVIHPSCKWLIKNLKEAIYDKSSIIPKLLKESTQHGLDATLHLVHEVGKNSVKSYSYPVYSTQPMYNGEFGIL